MRIRHILTLATLALCLLCNKSSSADKCAVYLIFLEEFDQYYSVYFNNKMVANSLFKTNESTGMAYHAMCLNNMLNSNSLVVKNRGGKIVFNITFANKKIKKYIYIRKYADVWYPYYTDKPIVLQ